MRRMFTNLRNYLHKKIDIVRLIIDLKKNQLITSMLDSVIVLLPVQSQ